MVQYQHISNGINSNSYGIERKQTGSWVPSSMIWQISYSLSLQPVLSLYMLKSKIIDLGGPQMSPFQNWPPWLISLELAFYRVSIKEFICKVSEFKTKNWKSGNKLKIAKNLIVIPPPLPNRSYFRHSFSKVFNSVVIAVT